MEAPVTTTVSPVPPAAPAAPVAPAAKPETVSAADWQKKIDDLTEQVAENRRTAEFWADKAKKGEKPAKVKEPEEEEIDVLDILATKGAKGLDEVLAKRGFVRADEVDSKVNAKAAALVKENELTARYPDLKKKDSDFFKTTAGHYGELVKAGTPQSLAMELAAEKTELELIRSGKIKLPGAEPTKEEKEATRLRRIAAQGGDGGNRGPAHSEEDDAELTAEQKKIAAGFGISEEAYAKRAKSGVAMKGIR